MDHHFEPNTPRYNEPGQVASEPSERQDIKGSRYTTILTCSHQSDRQRALGTNMAPKQSSTEHSAATNNIIMYNPQRSQTNIINNRGSPPP